MAKETVVEERIYTIPIRRSWIKAPAGKRNKRALNSIRLFLSRHMKANEVWISPKVNESIWKGVSGSIKVKVRNAEGVLKAYLHDEVIERPKAIEEKKQEKQAGSVKPEGAAEAKKEIEKAETKDIVKSEEIKSETKTNEKIEAKEGSKGVV